MYLKKACINGKQKVLIRSNYENFITNVPIYSAMSKKEEEITLAIRKKESNVVWSNDCNMCFTNDYYKQTK